MIIGLIIDVVTIATLVLSWRWVVCRMRKKGRSALLSHVCGVLAGPLCALFVMGALEAAFGVGPAGKIIAPAHQPTPAQVVNKKEEDDKAKAARHGYTKYRHIQFNGTSRWPRFSSPLPRF